MVGINRRFNPVRVKQFCNYLVIRPLHCYVNANFLVVPVRNVGKLNVDKVKSHGRLL